MATRTRSSFGMTTYRPQAPIIRIAAPRAIAPRAAKKSHRRRKGGGGGMGGGLTVMEGAIAGAVVGMATKSGVLSKLPTVPMLGRMGTLAVGAHFYSKHGGGPMARKVALVAAILAGNEFGREGSIEGEDVDGDDD